MTTTPAPSITTYDLTGTAVGPFATAWKYADAADVRLWIETAGIAGADLTSGVDYTLTASAPLTSGGSATLSALLVPANGWPAATRLVLRRRTARRQATGLPDTEGHKPRATEKALDKAMRIAEEDRDDLDRALVVPPGETALTIPPLAARANRFLTFDDDGAPRVVERPEDFDGLNKANRNFDNADFDPDGDGEVFTPALTRLREWRTPEDYGAAGNDAALDGAAIRVALEKAQQVRFLGDLAQTPLRIDDDTTLEPRSGQTLDFSGGGRIEKLLGANLAPMLLIDGKERVRLIRPDMELIGGRDYGIYIRNSKIILIDHATIGRKMVKSNSGATPLFIAKNCQDIFVDNPILRGGGVGLATGGDPLAGEGTADGPVERVFIRGGEISLSTSEGIDVNWDTHDLWCWGTVLRENGWRGDSPDNEALDIGGATGGDGQCTNINFDGITIYLPDNSGNAEGFQNPVNAVLVKSSTDTCRLNNFTVRGPGAAGSTALRYKNAIRTFADNWDVDGCACLLDLTEACADVSLTNSTARNISEGGVTSQAGGAFQSVDLTNTKVIAKAGATGWGGDFRNIDDLDLTDFEAAGFLAANAYGAVIASSCSRVVGSPLCNGNTNGVSVNAAFTRIKGGRIRGNVNEGVVINAADVIVDGVLVKDNNTGAGAYYDVRITGAADRLVWGDNQVGTAQIQGAVTGGQMRGRFEAIPVGMANLLNPSGEQRGRFDGVIAGQNSGTQEVGNSGLTVVPFVTSRDVVFVNDLTSNRTITFDATNATPDFEVNIVRTAAGAGSLTATGLIGGDALIAQNQGIKVRWRPAGFFVAARWSLV